MSVLLRSFHYSKTAKLAREMKVKAKLRARKHPEPENIRTKAKNNVNVRCWQFMMDGIPYYVVLDLTKMEVICNRSRVETVDDFTETGARFDFVIGCHKARIESLKKKYGNLMYNLTIDGVLVPE